MEFMADRYHDQVETMIIGFRHELCETCGFDLDSHLIGPDVLGNAHAYCLMED